MREGRKFFAKSGLSAVSKVMDAAFKTLFDFIALHEGEVSGRAVLEPAPEEATQLERFVRGECSALERAQLCSRLRENPASLRWLAARVKLARRSTHTGDARLAQS